MNYLISEANIQAYLTKDNNVKLTAICDAWDSVYRVRYAALLVQRVHSASFRYVSSFAGKIASKGNCCYNIAVTVFLNYYFFTIKFTYIFQGENTFSL